MIVPIFRQMLRMLRNPANEKKQSAKLSEYSARRMLYFYEHIRGIQQVEGAIVECGVGWGHSLLALAIALRALGQDRSIFGFDSFDGFPDPSPEDLPGKARRGHYKTNQESVIEFLINSGLPPKYISSHVSLVPGFFSDSLHKKDTGIIAFLHLDVDIYTSYKETLEFFYPRVSKGGIIAFDEYQSTTKYPGARKAIDEFFLGRREKICRSPMVDRFYTVKM